MHMYLLFETAPVTPAVSEPLSPALKDPECGEVRATFISTNMSCWRNDDRLQFFLESAAPHPMTPEEKARLAAKGIIDPFNLLTIGGLSAISIAANAKSPYGPAVHGCAKLSGVSLTQDMTHEFVGTFAIPS